MKFGRVVLRLLIVLLLVPVCILGVLSLAWAVGRQDAGTYIPKDYRAYVEIESISALYEATIDNPATETLVSQLGIDSLTVRLWDLRTIVSQNRALSMALLDMGARIVSLPDGSSLAVIDTGGRGIFVQLLPLLEGVFRPEGIRISKQTIGGTTVYGLATSGQDKDSAYVAYAGGNLIASDTVSGMNAAMNAAADPSARLDPVADIADMGLLTERHTLAVSFRTGELMDALAVENPLIARMSEQLILPLHGALGITLLPDGIRIEAASVLRDNSGRMTKLFGPDAVPRILSRLPERTSIFSGISVSSFKELYEAWAAAFPEQDPNIEGYDGLARTLFGRGVDDLVFSWPGNELGIAYTDRSTAPVLMIELSDPGAFDAILNDLNASLFVDADEGLILDGIRISRLTIPDVWRGILLLFGQNFDIPYHVRVDDWLYISPDPENLALFARLPPQSAGQTEGEEGPEDISARIRQAASTMAADGVVFFDMSRTRPQFVRSVPLADALLRLYRHGYAGFSIKDGILSLRLEAGGARVSSAEPVAGFPVVLENLIHPDPRFFDSSALFDSDGGPAPELLYVDEKNRVVRANLQGRMLASLVMSNPGHILPQLGNGDTAWWNERGEFLFLPRAFGGADEQPEVQTVPVGNTFLPRRYRAGWLAYSEEHAGLGILDKDGGFSLLSDGWDVPVLAEPRFAGDGALVGDRSLDGAVFRTDPEFRVVGGPVYRAGGLLAGSPVLEPGPGGSRMIDRGRVVALTQGGRLSWWALDPGIPDDSSGSKEMGTTFSTGPVLIEARGAERFALLDTGGTVRVLDESFRVQQYRHIEQLADRDQLFRSFAKGGRTFLIARGGNSVYLFDTTLALVPGFPVPGRAVFVYDLDADGSEELVTLGVDSRIHVYRIPWKDLR